MDETKGTRINKYIADKGWATRKDADILIQKGAVLINGKRAELGQRVGETDMVEVKARKTKYRYYAFHKPLGVVTHSPQLGEKDAVVSSALSGVFPVGRLDKASTGLLILTNDARVTDRLLNPKYEHEKEYRVQTNEKIPSRFKERMEHGVHIEEYRTKQCRVHMTGENSFTIVLVEGKKHQIRRMCAAFGLTVKKLARLRVMNIGLGKLKTGEQRAVAGAELEQFLASLHLS